MPWRRRSTTCWPRGRRSGSTESAPRRTPARSSCARACTRPPAARSPSSVSCAASARTPLFQAFPRVGIPRAFGSYGEYVRAVDLLLDCDAFPDPTYLWWDVRPQPKLGTVEIRIMDAQSTLGAMAALVALVQCLVRLELVDGHADAALVHAPEVLDENRFLAARDGVSAEFVDPVQGRAVSIND